jgi:hypothetical protein
VYCSPNKGLAHYTKEEEEEEEAIHDDIVHVSSS